MAKRRITVREQQSELFQGVEDATFNPKPATRQSKHNVQGNKLNPEDRHFHDWYRFVFSFPPHLVRTYLEKFSMGDGSTLLDPFCGCGTTLVEGKLAHLKTIGVEANPFAQFASRIKIDWGVQPKALSENSEIIAERTLMQLQHEGLNDSGFLADLPVDLELRSLPEEKMRLLLTNSISPIPLHKALVLLDNIDKYGNERLKGHELLAFSKAVVFGISNLHFGPEVGVGTIKADAPVTSIWL